MFRTCKGVNLAIENFVVACSICFDCVVIVSVVVFGEMSWNFFMDFFFFLLFLFHLS